MCNDRSGGSFFVDNECNEESCPWRLFLDDDNLYMYTTKQKNCNKLENLDLSYFNINLPSLNQQIKVEMHKF